MPAKSKNKVTYNVRLRKETLIKLKALTKKINTDCIMEISQGDIIDAAIHFIYKEKMDKLFDIYADSIKQ